MVDEGVNYGRVQKRRGRHGLAVSVAASDMRRLLSEGESPGEIEVLSIRERGREEHPETPRRQPPVGSRPGLLTRIAHALLPSEPGGHPPSSVSTQEPQAADPVLELAYVAVTERLCSQSTTLESLRTRATGIFSVAALVTSFAAGIGMINTDPDKGDLLPTWAPWALFGILVVMGWCVMVVLWPYKRWAYGPSGRVILELWELGAAEDEVRRRVTSEMLAARERNEEQLVKRAWAYRGAVFLLLAETLVLVSAIAEQQATE